MITGIYFDEDTRSFSTDGTKAPSKIWEHLKKHEGKYITGAASAVGGTSGALIAKNAAKKEALRRGLEPGTPEYKKFVRNRVMVGATAGTATGVVGSVAGHGVVNLMKNNKAHKAAGTKAAKGENWGKMKKGMKVWKAKQA